MHNFTDTKPGTSMEREVATVQALHSIIAILERIEAKLDRPQPSNIDYAYSATLAEKPAEKPKRVYKRKAVQ